MYYFAVTKAEISHKEFWRLSWYEIGLYVDRYNNRQEEKEAFQISEWMRFRIQWADFRNANRGKNGRIVYGHDLIKLPVDERVPEYHEIDMEAMKRRFGSKIKKKKDG